ncbi:MAG: serine/threonine protein kinase [Comamonadaceae bacterium]|jgi:tetratricopeptide (TPR) repeat protein|nr:serine/threonine protein kinase [Comamonadaceae bacterium]
MTASTKERWLALSPLLDDLLDLDEAERALHLDALAAQDPALADELRALLAQEQALNDAGFLDRPVAEALHLDDAAITAGMAIGPYRLERELGQGGMGSVWTAQRADGRFEGRVAVKFLRAGLFAAGDAGRFAREGQILARLSHPHIARLLDAGVQQGQPYLVLEYVDGQPIDAYCREQGLDVEARVRLFLDVLAAVGHAHARLILHRDLKPSNILVTRDGEVKLLDFGIAKLLDDAGQGQARTELTQLAGHAYTPQYAAPEQVQQTEVTTATDVYALGVLLYQLLGGGHPTAADTAMRLDLLKAVVEQVPRRLSDAARQGGDALSARQARQLRGDLDTIVAKALKKQPAERYVNAEAMAGDLRRWLAHEPIGARPDSRLYVLGRFVRRHRLAVAAGSTAVLLLLASTATSLLQARRAEAAEHQAQARRQQAEDLLGYMLGELADKLRPIGRLELLDGVGSKAQALLERQPDADAHTRLQRARALAVIAEVRVAKSEFDDALQALLAAQKLVQDEPSDEALVVSWYRTRGAIAFWQGEVARLQRRLDAQEDAWLSYRDFAERWRQRSPADSDALLEVSYAQTNLGSLALLRGRLGEAEKLFRSSLEAKTAALVQKPDRTDLQGDVANTISWLGNVLTQSGQLRSARASYLQGLEKIEAVRAARPDDLAWLKKQADMQLRLAELELDMGLLPAAFDHLQAARAGARRLVQADPSNQTWLLGQLYTEALALFHDEQPVHVRSRRTLELLAQLAALRGGKGAPESFLVRQAGLLQMATASGCTAGSCAELAEHLAKAASAIQSARTRSPHDLQLLDAAVRLALSGPALRVSGEREAMQGCARAAELLGSRDGWRQVHAGLTRSWLTVQNCIRADAAPTPDMVAAQAWLSAQRGR